MTALFRASLVLFTSSRASADPTVDDVVTASDGYTTQWLTFPPKGTMVLNPGMLVWTVGAAGSVYAAFVQPLSINENAYGTNAIGWGKQTYHFTDLVGSDKAEFDFTNGAGQKFIYALDYVRFLNSKS